MTTETLQQYGNIYMITCKTDNNKAYIGQTTKTIEKRFQGHLANFRFGRRESLLYESMEQNGIKNFEIILLRQVPVEKLDKYERKYIQKYNTLYPNGYNILTGGKQCNKVIVLRKYDGHDADTREKISKAQLGNRRSGKINREVDHTGNQLAKNISFVKKNNKIIGYFVNSFATGVTNSEYFSKKFTSEKFTPDENLMFTKLCINELITKYPAELWNREETQVLHKFNLPEFIDKLVDEHDKHIGYRVKSDEITEQDFTEHDMMCDNLKDAVSYKNNFKKNDDDANFLSTLTRPKYVAVETVKQIPIGFKINKFPYIDDTDGQRKVISRKFCSKNLSLEANYNLTINFLNELNEKYNTSSKQQD